MNGHDDAQVVNYCIIVAEPYSCLCVTKTGNEINQRLGLSLFEQASDDARQMMLYVRETKSTSRPLHAAIGHFFGLAERNGYMPAVPYDELVANSGLQTSDLEKFLNNGVMQLSYHTRMDRGSSKRIKLIEFTPKIFEYAV